MTRYLLALLLLPLAKPALAQDTLRLGALQEAATERDPRARQFALRDSATALRLDAINTGRLPRITVAGDASVQSDVTSFGGTLPGGASVPQPPKERYQATVTVEQLLYDGGEVSQRRAVEKARLAEARAGIATELNALRGEVNQAFFSTLLLQERLEEIDVLITDLHSRLSLVSARVQEGVALAGDSAVILAELLETRQTRAQVEADRHAALEVLERLTETPINSADRLALPDLARQVESTRARDSEPRTRPEFAGFERSRELLEEQRRALASERLPRIVAFGQGGVGRPGLDQFNRSLDDFWMAGLQLRWSPWDWGRVSSEQDALEIQREIVTTEEAAFADRIDREVRNDLAAIDRLVAILATDDQIVLLREQVEQQALARLEEGVITATEYVDRRGELLRARLAGRQHRVELARAQAGYLTTLGLDFP